MINVVTEISKYLMLILMLIYTVFNFIAINVKTVKRVRRLCAKQLLMVFLLLLLGYLILVLRTGDISIVIFFLIQIAFYFLYYRVFSHIYENCSCIILSNVILLFGLGNMMLTRLDYDKAIRQFVIGVAAFILSFFIPAIIKHFKSLSKFAWIYALVGIGLLAVVWRLGNTTLGAQLTLSIAGINLQPSEFVKISYVLFTAAMFRRNRSFKVIAITTLVAAAHVLILVASTDLGSGLVYFVSFLFMLFAATHKPLYPALGVVAGAGAAVLAYNVFDHVKIRVKMWIDPFVDYENKGYQLSQSMFAISSGGLFGMGLCQGRPETIPLARNDYMFSAICEELGIIFACCLILIYLGFLLQLFKVSNRLSGQFYQIMGVGFASMIGTQVFMHIGGVTGMIPSTGITLPLVSYGGSSVLSTMIIIGIIQGLSITSDGLTARQRASMQEQALYEGGEIIEENQ